MESKLFSYKPGIVLEPFNDALKLSAGFDRKEILKKVNEILKEQNFNIDESTINFKIKENELYIDGLASDISERKSIGFMTGN